MSHAEITIEEEELIKTALKYLKENRIRKSPTIAAWEMVRHWEELVSTYEKETRKHFWSKRGHYLIEVIVKRYVQTKPSKK